MNTGIWIEMSIPAQEKLFAKLDSEGYAATPEGVAVFLHDVSTGKLDSEQNETVSQTALNLLREHGPAAARVLGTILQGRR